MRTGLSRRWIGLGATAAALAALLVPVPSVRGDGEPVPQTPESLAAMWVSRVALTDLRIIGSPKERDYRLSAQLLEIAKGFTPGDEILTRYLLEANENAGNQARVDELTAELIALDPGDTVSVLRLISSKIRNLQSVQERLAQYDRLLGPKGEVLDPSVRSRLALDAALLARENGDAAGFASRLSRAIELDATNKDAATLALTFFTARVNDPVGRLELMLAVLNADPIDSDTHLAIARHLASSGAFTGASRFFKTADFIRRTLNIESNTDDDIERRIVDWHVQGPRSVIDVLNRAISDQRAIAAKALADAERKQQSTEGMTRPENVPVPMAYQWLRLLAAHALGDADLVRPALEELLASARLETERLGKPDERGKEISDQEAADRIRGLREESVAARLWAGQDLEKAAQELDTLRGDPAVDPVKLRRLEAVSKMRAGELDAAAAVLTALGPDDEVAQLWLCLVEEARGDKAASAAKYREFFRQHTGTLLGAYAWTRAEQLAGKAPADQQVKKLEQVAAAVPNWLESVIDSPRKFQSLQVKVEPLEARMMESVKMEITVRNVSPIPLGVGPDRTINSRMLVAPSVQVSTKPIRTAEMLQVASIERRLRLNPRDELRIQIYPDAGSMATTLDQAYSKPVRVQYQVLQGFELDPEAGIYRAGPFSLSASAGPVIRATSIKADADVASITRWAESGTPRELLESIMLMRGRDMKLGNSDPFTADEQRAVYSVIAKRFDKLEPAWQVAVICAAPTASMSPRVQPMDEPAVAPLDEAARNSPNLNVRTIMLALRTAKPEDTGAYAADPKLTELAELVRARLSDGTQCFANWTPPAAPAPEADSATPAEK